VLLKGDSFLIRFADDFLLGFTNKEDAIRVMEVLPKRLGKFGLTLHPEKTRLIELGEEKGQPGQEKKTFDFLGFTHYMGISRKGKRILKRKTSSKKLNASLKRMSEWIKLNRHKLSMPLLIAELNQKLRGHYAYYGMTFNTRNGGTVCRKAARTGLWGSGEATNRSTRNQDIEDLSLIYKLKSLITSTQSHTMREPGQPFLAQKW